MPIHADSIGGPLSEEMFKDIAYAVMGVAFALHNEYGSLLSEDHYKSELAAACRKLGFGKVEVEVPIEVMYADFSKQYYVDLLIEGGALFELKVASALANGHRAQTLNYLFLTGLQRAKLINFGSTSVEHEFVSTTLTPTDRKLIAVHHDRWICTNQESARLEKLFMELLHDWGCFLLLPLYYEAMTHFLGGEERVVQEVPVVRQGVIVSKQRVHLLNEDTAFTITANGDDVETVEEHIRRFLSHTALQTVQWINLYHHDVTFTTLRSVSKHLSSM